MCHDEMRGQMSEVGGQKLEVSGGNMFKTEFIKTIRYD